MASETPQRFLCGVDTGGTFTDCVAIDPTGRLWTAKTPSTPPDFAQGFFQGLALLSELMGLDLRELLARSDQIVHGTTVATNALVERRGAKVGLVATRGHRDAIFVMRGVGRVAGLTPDEAMRTLGTRKPNPLVEKRFALEVDERIDWKGDVILPLEDNGARRVIAQLAGAGAEAIAIALLWSFRNPMHEARLEELVAELAPGVHVSRSGELAPRAGEYERTAAAVIDAYVKPVTVAYLGELARRCAEFGFRGQLLVMQSDGNVAPVERLIRAPLLTLQSGPAAGLEASRVLGLATRRPDAIVLDMGGTTSDIGLVVGGRSLRRTSNIVSQYEYFTPSVEIDSIGVAGGSVAWIDELSGAMRVGPRSAGATPGPACYGRGGREPTVTDADLLLGRLNADYFLGGRMQLDVAAAESAIGRVAELLGREAPAVAAGISRLAEVQVAEEIRKLTIAKGYDPRDFAVFAYGGAGPVHAGAVARDLAIGTVIVPMGDVSSLWSAFGAATSDLGVTFEQSVNLLEPFDLEAVVAELEVLRGRAREALADSGVDGADLEYRLSAGLRYRAQVNEVWVELEQVPVSTPDLAWLLSAFEEEYEALFGEGTGYRAAGVELSALRCVAELRRLPAGMRFRTAVEERPKQEAETSRPVYWEEAGAYVETCVVAASALGEREIEGAAIVELEDTTVVVHPGQRAARDELGNIVLRLDPDADRRAPARLGRGERTRAHAA